MQNSRRLLVTLICALIAMAVAGSAQTIGIVSGQGQLLCASCPGTTQFGFNALVARVTDAAGNPVPNATVNWAVVSDTSGTASIGQATTLTDANGLTSNTLVLPIGVGPGTALLPIIQASATATVPASGSSVTFYGTSVAPQQSGVNPVNYQLITVPSANVVGQAGSGCASGLTNCQIVVAVAGPFGGIQNVAVSLLPDNTDPTLGPTIACDAPSGIVLTDASGTATCNFKFGGKPLAAQNTFSIVVGGGTTATFPNAISYQVTPGQPAIILTTCPVAQPNCGVFGNGFTGKAGDQLNVIALVTDIQGNPSVNATVTWSVNPPAAATLRDTTSTTAADGRTAVFTTVGSVPGPFTITATSGSATGAFNLTNAGAPISSMMKQSGDNQAAAQNTAFAQPLMVQVLNTQGQGVQGAVVSFAVTSGSATLSGPSATANAQGQASVSVTAGPTAGPVVITASARASPM